MVSYLGYGITFPIVWAPAVRACVAFPVVGFILIALRIYARRWQKRRLGADDIFGVMAWVRYIVTLASMMQMPDMRLVGLPRSDGGHLCLW